MSGLLLKFRAFPNVCANPTAATDDHRYVLILVYRKDYNIMIKYLITFIFILNNPLFSQVDEAIWDQNQISNITVLLFQQISDTTADIGAGTIINHQDRYYLLTANHVTKKLKNDAKLIFRLSGDKPGIINLLPIVKNNSLEWKNHPVADISLIELIPINENIDKRLKNWSFPSQLINNGKNLPKIEADLTFLGYPVVDLKMEHFSPLIFTGYRTSGLITQKRYDNGIKCNFYFLNVPSIQGCSGSGVYLSMKKGFYYNVGKTLMIGIVHGTKGDSTGGKMAAITPSYYIFDLIK